MPRSRSVSEDSANQVCCAWPSSAACAAAAVSSSASCPRAAARSRSSVSRRAADRGLVGRLARLFVPQRDVVVGEQAEPGVAQVGLDGGRLAGDLRLPAQGLQAPVELRGQVDEPGQVDLHRLKLAQRLLLALAVLEDAGRLLDDRAPRLGAGVQDLVELALADDDVHLAAKPAVGEQVLHVQQAAAVAVDGVLALAGAEHQPADRHLGVVDRQGAVGVVDGERDLGAAERGAGGGAGEDDVFHLAAAQALGALFAHHPGERVDDVGLARAVGADDTGDPRLEAQRGGRGERLEAAQGEGLQVHEPSPPPGSACRTAAIANTTACPGLAAGNGAAMGNSLEQQACTAEHQGKRSTLRHTRLMLGVCFLPQTAKRTSEQQKQRRGTPGGRPWFVVVRLCRVAPAVSCGLSGAP